MPRKLKVFLDSSALIAGLNSPNGSAGVILSAFRAGHFIVYVSDQVVDEVTSNIRVKFPLLGVGFVNFLLARPIVVKTLAAARVEEAFKLIETDDAPILAAAIKCRPDYLITWDRKHFLKNRVVEAVPFIICTPADFLQQYWRRQTFG